MASEIRPYRSVLYIPGSNARALEKAKSLPTDAIIFDLEDAVAASEKAAARDRLAEVLSDGDFGHRVRLVRINGLDTPWAADDLTTLAEARPDAILVPKVSDVGQAERLASRMDVFAGYDETAVWAMIESPESVLNARSIARGPRMAGFVVGTNDLAKDIGAIPGANRAELQTALQMSLIAARAGGLIAVDGVYNAFRDEVGLVAECAQGRALGFDGKSLIHPSQIAPTNAAFSPGEAEVDLARRRIAAFEEASAAGRGIAVLDGQIVENLHVAAAQRIIAIDGAIRSMEG